MIKPSVGRIVLFRTKDFTEEDQSRAAIVTFVHTDRRINVCSFDSMGYPEAYQDIQLLQDDDKPTDYYHCKWMDYQVGQAAKYEEEAKKNKA